ncbi:hypothetical protein NliqN6_1114 [Naganishia liquefaciens]|uniref:Uncharacterized protein n=1 Tax=Naganishia liquefaciens TaxID=104408 RepID=A0A8H3TPA5_9TREE|nr:hypothetical protein NliqN6_1114 [Naganishia liquefaciens]
MPQDEDLDDLDDILDDFSAPPKPAAPKPSPPPQQQQRQQDDPSEADLARQMAALLASLGGPQDGEADARGKGQGDDGDGDGDGDDDDDLTKLLAQIMRAGQGQEDETDGAESGMDGAGFEQLLASLGQPAPIPTASGSTSTSTAPTRSKPPAAASTDDKPLSFEETIKRTMSNLKDSEASSRANASSAPDPNDPLAQLLASLNIDPSELDLDALAAAAAAAGGGGADPQGAGGDFSGVLDGMMKQLMTKEILEEPLAELADKYPPYLATHGASLPAAQRTKYTQQNAIVVQILEIFRDPAYSDASDAQRSRVTALMTQMQDLGSPPDEIMGDMPEGLDLGGEGCTIM